MFPKLVLLIVLLASSLGFVGSPLSQVAKPPKTKTGFYYPVNNTLTTDYNWLACGKAYYTDLRHIGADIGQGAGQPVYSIATGKVVTKSGPKLASGWGEGNYALIIRHTAKSGEFYALYGHIKTTLNVNDPVTAGQRLGTTEKILENGKEITKPHLHFGISQAFPSPPFGRVADVGCKKPGLTNGFTAPVTFINTNTPK